MHTQTILTNDEMAELQECFDKLKCSLREIYRKERVFIRYDVALYMAHIAEILGLEVKDGIPNDTD